MSDLQETTIGKIPAFTFNFDSSFHDVRGGFTVNSESTAVIFSDGRMNYIAIYETSDDKARSVLQTLKFD